MKFDAHVSNVGFILYLVAQVIPEPQKANQSFVPRFLCFNPNNPPGTGIQTHAMNTYLLLIGISIIPAIATILLTFPLWYLKKINNQTIFICGLMILFIILGCILVFAFDVDSPGIGFASIAVSSINIFLFRHYLRILFITRCPMCRHIGLQIHSRRQNVYRLYCRKCGTNTEWWE